MTDFIKLAQELSAENDGVLNIFVVRDFEYKLFVNNKNFSEKDLLHIAADAVYVDGAMPHWKIPMPKNGAKKLILESNLFLLCSKVLGKTKNKA